MSAKTRLELTWIGKDQRPRLEPRILIEDERLSHHAARRREGDLFDNILIQGDNLLALRALEQDFTGKVKCVFIDPPYNTGSAFEHYDDGLEHSIWLSMMRDRLEIIWRLMSDDGSLWVTLDDNEAHYFKVMCDEVFGRSNFIGDIAWEKSDSPRMDAIHLSTRHDHLFVYGKNIDEVEWHRLITSEPAAHYDKKDEQGRPYYLKPLRAMGGQGDSRATRPNLYFAMIAPDGTSIFPVRQDGTDGAWRWSPDKVKDEIDRIEWITGRSGWAPYFRIYSDLENGRPVETIWPHEEVGSNRTSKAEIKRLFPASSPFATPKPERLLERVIHVASNPGDLVLDSFAGSGTTGAVAHKMKRRWIMVELGGHCESHIVPRMEQVVDGHDPGGVTKSNGWKGGGGYRFYRLAPSLMEKDSFGQWVISKDYDAARLAEAMCKHLAFTYAPSDQHYWMHGRSSESDFLYVTTSSLTHEQLRAISDEVGSDRTLLICCKAFQNGHARTFDNLTITKIPAAILDRCEWDRDDYSLKIQALPLVEDEAEPHPESARARGRPAARASNQTGLFDSEDEA